MGMVNDIPDALVPDHLPHPGLERTDRRQTRHMIVLASALCTGPGKSQVGQAGIGDIHQVQVSIHSPVPEDPVIAQPQKTTFTSPRFFMPPTRSATRYCPLRPSP